MTLEQKIAFFETHHYLLLPAVLTPEELAALNAAIDRNREKFWTQFAARHQGGNDRIFVDGHSKWLKKDYVERHPELFYSIRP